jgi:hypothetical protein
VLLLYIGIYLLGTIAGLAARNALDLQVRRPGLRPTVGLFMLVFLLWGAISITHTQFTDVLVPLLWGGTGLLAGVGSRELYAAP